MSKATIKISVIIPVYNVESYLHECIDSILNQNYTNLEVILINDGSLDKSGIICNEYALKDQRVKVLHQENQGVSIARNLGLQHATGDYINFIDADDWIDQGMYLDIVSSILTAKNTVDVVYMPYPNEEQKINKISYNQSEIRSEFIYQFIGSKKICSTTKMASVWSLFIRKEIIENLFFHHIATIEDKPFFIETILRANTLFIIKKKYYNYRINPSSLSRNYHKEFIQSVTLGHKIINEMLKKYAPEYTTLNYMNDNSIISFYYYSIKNELSNKETHQNFNLLKQAIEKYDIDNNLKTLLTWERTFKLSYRNPKWMLVKLGYVDTFLNILWKRKIKQLKKTPGLLPQS